MGKGVVARHRGNERPGSGQPQDAGTHADLYHRPDVLLGAGHAAIVLVPSFQDLAGFMGPSPHPMRGLRFITVVLEHRFHGAVGSCFLSIHLPLSISE